MEDKLVIGGVELRSRLFTGTGKCPYRIIPDIVNAAKASIITVALRRVDIEGREENILNYIPNDVILMPNTSGARTAEEAVRIARLARACGCGNWIKIEVISDNRYLLPDNFETIKATEILAAEDFVVMPYMIPDLYAARRLKKAGAASLMPLGAPIGTNRGIKTKEMIRIMIEETDLPVIIDAGIGKPHEAAEALEIGAAAVLVNTAIASAENPVKMAEAFHHAVTAGRLSYLAGTGAISITASASSPLTGFLG